MSVLGIIIASIFLVALIITAYRYDPLVKFEPITDQELMLLSLIDEDFYVDLLEYIRTMNMSSRLQDHLKDKTEALKSIKYYMLTQAALTEHEKRSRWEKERKEPKDPSLLSHNERMILQRLKK